MMQCDIFHGRIVAGEKELQIVALRDLGGIRNITVGQKERKLVDLAARQVLMFL